MTTDKQQQFIELRAKGNSYNKISELISVSKPTLIGWSHELEIELENYKVLEQEALREEYFATKKHRIIMQGKHLKLIQEELEKRDFSQIPTSKLIELAIRLSDNLSQSDQQVVFTADGLQKMNFRYKWTG